ncbi:MAG: hypothetical protein ACLP01_26575 [Solirubrobacteraceae bacterium]
MLQFLTLMRSSSPSLNPSASTTLQPLAGVGGPVGAGLTPTVGIPPS